MTTRAYYTANKAKVLAANRARTQAIDPEELRSRRKRWRQSAKPKTPEQMRKSREAARLRYANDPDRRARAVASAKRQYASNKQAALARADAWNKRNPECRRAIKQRRRARINGTDQRVTRQEIGALLVGAVCAACGCAENPEIDHILPLALGGGSTRDNLQVLCRPCNRSKGAKHPNDWDGRKVQ